MDTSEPDSLGTNLFIGEVATFRLQFEAPEGTTSQAAFIDTLPTGLGYVAGSARLARVFDAGLMASANPGGINAAPSGAFVGLTDGTDVTFSGQNVTVTLGNVTNQDSDANTEGYVLELQTVAQNVPTNLAGGSLINQGRLTFLDQALQPQALTANGPPLVLLEAQLPVSKTASPTVLNSAVGGIVHFTITVTNAAGAFAAPAYNVTIFDSLPSGLQSLSNLSINAPGASGLTSNSTGAKVDIDIAMLPAGAQVVINFDAVAPPPVNLNLINAVSATWTSLPGTHGTNNATAGNPGTTFGERTVANGYKLNAKATVTLVNDPTATRTRMATSTPLPTNTNLPTNTPIGSGATRTPTPTPPGGSTLTPTRLVPSPTPTPSTRGDMGVRFVSVGRVRPGSDMYYSVALVIYSRGTVPGVRAELQVPAEVEFLGAEPAPTTAPPIGGSGLVFWDLGDLTGPANSPLSVHARVRADVVFGTQFTGQLHVENARGQTWDLTRLSRSGRSDRVQLKKDRNTAFSAKIKAPSRINPGSPILYAFSASARAPLGFSTLVVRALVPAGAQVTDAMPAATVLDAPPGSAALLEWRFVNPGRRVWLTILAVADPQLPPGATLNAFVSFDDEQGSTALVVGPTGIQ